MSLKKPTGAELYRARRMKDPSYRSTLDRCCRKCFRESGGKFAPAIACEACGSKSCPAADDHELECQS